MIQPQYWMGVGGHLHTLATGIEPLSDLGYYGEDLNLFSLLGIEA
jgi:hypothetical protein